MGMGAKSEKAKANPTQDPKSTKEANLHKPI